MPEGLHALFSLALNLRWSWDSGTEELFKWVDPEAWEAAGHDPMKMLGLVGAGRFEELLADEAFMSYFSSVEADLEAYLTKPRWFQERGTEAGPGSIAYFSPEFGVSEALPVYSGGLGVLAGDHLKAASDLGVPLVAVGLLYREGYFRQHLNQDGWQQERYPKLDPHGMPLTLMEAGDGSPLKIEVDLAETRCVAQIWRADVGRVPLLLLDCDVDDNPPEERVVTDRLYGGGSEHRLRQEIVLGIGGVRALDAAGFEPQVFHSNEGHAGFMGLERIRRLVAEEDIEPAVAVEAVRAGTVFTTHTPVPAGIDVYESDLMEKYFESFAKGCGLTFDELMMLGEKEPGGGSGTFNMAVMGFRLAGRSNGVSKLHGVVSRSIFSELWPQIPDEDVPIGSVTNGVHAPTWLGPEMSEVLDRRFPKHWTETGSGRWDKIPEVPDGEFWRARERSRERLVYFVRQRLRDQLLARGVSEAETSWTQDVFDPGILTIGFARRFAPYKRGTLLLSDETRLLRLLVSGDRPIQIVIAGKAHPLDDAGKELIRDLVHFSARPEMRSRFAFIEDYDMEVARVLVQGADVWLNNPRRPLEASGTSGMKAALNGAVNLSVLDGWWDECYDGSNGWAIGTVETYEDADLQDRVEASALYDLLEREVVPRFYDRPAGPVPHRWIERVKASMSTLGGFVTANRMVRDYVEALYEPAREHGLALKSDGFDRARSLAAWKSTVREKWGKVHVIEVEGDVTGASIGDERAVSATVHVGELSTDDILVELAHGPVGANDSLTDPSFVEMKPDRCTDGTCLYKGSFSVEETGLYGFAVRVLPTHPDLTSRFDLGLAAWA